MTQTLEAVYDGAVLHPAEPLAVEPNTRVRIVVETMPQDEAEPASFLRTARSLNLDGPPDWAANIDAYLYGEEAQRDG